ncbi:MAG: F0F1 ATP synthase subunit delta [Sulfurospirillaceae bacterium]|nr:F0F1 ATP synthase subunit delta [Sulfurospirillaceae bacterium]
MFNWWTFLFQTINFFVVLYILYKLFFNPLKNIIQKRDENIKKRLEDLQIGEDKLKEQELHYQDKLKEIDTLKEKELSIARKEAEQEKIRLLEEIDKELGKERLKQKSILEHEKKKVENDIKEQSLQFSLDYLGRFVEEFIDEDIHQKLIEKFLYEIKSKNTNEIKILKEELKNKECEINISTPLNIKNETMRLIRETLENTFDLKIVSLNIITENSLIGGIRVGIENKIIDGSIQGRLKQLEDKVFKEL